MYDGRNIFTLQKKKLKYVQAVDRLKEKILSLNVKISEKDLLYSISLYKENNISKGEFIIKPGQYVKHWNFIISGCLCYYQVKDGQEKVLEFFEDNEFCTDLYAYLEEKPSNCYLKAMAETKILSVSKSDVEKSLNQSHELERFGRLSMQDSFIKAFRRISHLNTLSNEERYLRLLEKRPQLFQQVPQYLIASYLGITPVGLSKIRKRLSKSL